MSIITSIFQAIGQAFAWILPISESGHSAIFHNFSARYSGACSQLTGVVHIGIAIGILIAFFKLFKMLFLNFIVSWDEIFHKRFSIKDAKPARSFMYMTILSFVPLILYLIPAGKYGNIYNVFNRTSHNQTIAGEGLCLALTGVLIFAAAMLADKKINPLPKVLQALIIGVVVFLGLPTGGCSVIAAVLCVGILIGINEKSALRYAMVMSFMILIVMGIIEICVGVTSISIISIILALVFSIGATFVACKVLIFLIKSKNLKLVAIYDIALGVISLVIGLFQIIIK